MAKTADLGSKRLISLAPNNWVQWVTQQSDVEVQEFLSTEFQWIERESDVLLKVFSPQWGEFIVLNEIQLRYKMPMPERMRAYAALAEEKFKLPIYPVLINILSMGAPSVIPNSYQSEFMGIRAYQDYRVINLWEVDANLVFEQNLSSLLPFVPILRGGGEEAVVRRALMQLRENETLQDLEPLLSFFATFVLEIPIVRDIMRWDMTVLKESPWYNTILQEGWQEGLQEGLQEGRQKGLQEGLQKGLQKGRQEGLQEGRQEGLQKGLQEGEASLILRILRKRFGFVNEEIQNQIQQLNVIKLDQLGESLLDFASIAEVEAWLNQV